MKNHPIIQDLRKSACAHLNPHLFDDPQPKKGKSTPKRKDESKIKGWIAKQLWYWCQGNKAVMLVEYVFHGERGWRFDWALFRGVTKEQIERWEYGPEHMICAIEYEGIFSEKSRHTTAAGFTGDAEKYNAAQALGWKVIRYTAKNHKTILQDLEKLK